MFYLGSDTRIFIEQENVIFRKGIWNYQELSFSLSDIPDGKKEKYFSLFRDLAKEGEIKDSKVYRLNDTELIEHLNYLKYQGYLTDNVSKGYLSSLFGFDIDKYTTAEKEESDTEKILFVADDDTLESSLRANLELYDFKGDFIKFEEFYKDINALGDKVNALGFVEKAEHLKEKYDRYTIFAVSLSSGYVSFMKKLDQFRLLTSKKLFLSLQDGPFLYFMNFIDPNEGCFECFEYRTLSRMQDTHIYMNYIQNAELQSSSQDKSTEDSIAKLCRSTVSNIMVQDLILLIISDYGRFKNRIMEIYLPTFEVNFEDLHRVPFCETCGTISKLDVMEQNLKTSHVIKELTES